MSSTAISTHNPNIADLPRSWERKLDGSKAHLPEGTIVVSADSHWSLAEDPWAGRFPSHLKDRMPSMFWDEERGLWNMKIGEKTLFDGYVADIFRADEARKGISHMETRLQDLDADGIDMEILFPQYLLMFNRWPDFEAREWIFRGYNEYLAEVDARSGGRSFSVGFPNFWDPSKAEESIRHIKDLGLKSIIYPVQPNNDMDGKPILYASDAYDPLWACAEEAGLPVNFHVQESLNVDIPGGQKAFALGIFSPFRKSFSDLVFGGILDRHPKLRIIFVEAGINWIPGMLQDAEMINDAFGDDRSIKLEARPTDYWNRNCYATFMRDKIGLDMLDYVGIDNLMWAQDYPHSESTLGYTKSAMEEVVAAVSEADAKKILGGTAIELFDLP